MTFDPISWKNSLEAELRKRVGFSSVYNRIRIKAIIEKALDELYRNGLHVQDKNGKAINKREDCVVIRAESTGQFFTVGRKADGHQRRRD